MSLVFQMRFLPALLILHRWTSIRKHCRDVSPEGIWGSHVLPRLKAILFEQDKLGLESADLKHTHTHSIKAESQVYSVSG